MTYCDNLFYQYVNHNLYSFLPIQIFTKYKLFTKDVDDVRVKVFVLKSIDLVVMKSPLVNILCPYKTSNTFYKLKCFIKNIDQMMRSETYFVFIDQKKQILVFWWNFLNQSATILFGYFLYNETASNFQKKIENIFEKKKILDPIVVYNEILVRNILYNYTAVCKFHIHLGYFA